MLPPCVVFVCLPIPSTVASQMRPKLLAFRGVYAVASPSSSVCPAQPSVHGSGAQSQISRLRPGEVSSAQQPRENPRKSQALPAVCMGCVGPGDRQQAGRRCFSAEVNGEGWVSWSPRRLLDHSSSLLAIAALKGEQYPNMDPTASL